MSVVYEAEHVFTRRRVAIKLLHAQLARDPDIVRRFLQEARSAARIRHPSCVDILDMGQAPDGTLYLAEELLVGVDLRQHLRQTGRLRPEEALAIALPIVEALIAAHAQGVLHRDVKPANIFLSTVAGTSPGKTIRVPKLIDFGIAKLLEVGTDLSGETRAGVLLGTPRYMAPEQLQAERSRSIDGRVDVWAMGIVLYEMLTGKTPFAAEATHLSVIRILTEPASRLETELPALPMGLADAIHGALERERERRWATMEAFRQALLEVVAGHCEPFVGLPPADEERTIADRPAPGSGPVECDPQAQVETVVARHVAAEPEVLPEAGPERRLLPRERSHWGLVLLLVLVLGGGLLWVARSRQPAAERGPASHEVASPVGEGAPAPNPQRNVAPVAELPVAPASLPAAGTETRRPRPRGLPRLETLPPEEAPSTAAAPPPAPMPPPPPVTPPETPSNSPAPRGYRGTNDAPILE